jgi:hypothetical protein
MKLQIEEIEESELDIEDLEAEKTLQLAAVDAIRRARRCGTYYVIEEEDKVKLIPGDKTGPYEERLLARADELGRRITELRSQEQLVLNETPPPKK